VPSLQAQSPEFKPQLHTHKKKRKKKKRNKKEKIISSKIFLKTDLMKGTELQIKESLQTPGRITIKKTTSKHILKLLKRQRKRESLTRFSLNSKEPE
jgi:hypothetical protein